MNQLRQVFEQQAAEHPGQGAALCICRAGKEVLHLTTGEARPGRLWQQDTLVPVFSATKSAGAAAFLLALHRRGATPELLVGELWPECPAARYPIADLLSHRCGLAALCEPVPWTDLERCKSVLERTPMAWCPPAHGYHPHTFGPLLDILMLSLTGELTAEYWEREIRRPLALDLYLRVPEEHFARVAFLHPPRMQPGQLPSDDFYREYFRRDSEVWRAFHSMTGLESVREMNTPAAWQLGTPARGGVASARGLALFYQALLGQLPSGPFPPVIAEWMSTPRSSGPDRILHRHTSFGCGAMTEPAEFFGLRGFGHAGAGGSLAFAAPQPATSFAWVMNHMQLGILPGPRVQALLQACRTWLA